MTEKEFLTDIEREVVLFIERYHAVSGKTPDDPEILNYINNFADYQLTQTELNEIKNDHLFVASMRERGIILAHERVAGNLTPAQMAAAATMTNFVDRRSDEKKLRDLGITSEQWATWMQDDLFATYVLGRAEKMIANNTHEAHMGLMRGVRAGNTASIKLYYELTNRYNPDQDNAVNVKVMLGRILEIIQRHVKNPEVLNNLGADLMQLAIEQSAPQQQTQVGPKIIKQPLEL